MRSIERYLLWWIMGALSLGAVAIALVTYLITLDEMNEVYNADLKNVATALGTYHRAGGGLAPPSPVRTDVPDPAEIVTMIWTRDGQRMFSSDGRVAIPFMDQEALAQTRAGGEDWIVYTHVGRNGVAQAAQRSSARNDTAAESASKIIVPMAALVILVAALMVFALRRGLRPLDLTSRDIAKRSAASLSPISTADVPREIMPLVASINELMKRLSVAFATQRRFLADAAHELRTPLTALRLQLQLLKRAGDEASREEAITELDAGINRSQRLIEQLLQVARFEPDGESPRNESVDLAALARDVVGAMSAKADHLGIDLGAQAETAIAVDGDANQLQVLLINLVENALRYTPAGGVVDVIAKMQDGHPELRVVDDGPGIAQEERERVFERFYRTPSAPQLARDSAGTGLGLSIVRAIAQRHRAQVSLHIPKSGRGLEVRVVFTEQAGVACSAYQEEASLLSEAT